MSIKIRQSFKAEQFSRPVKLIQNFFTNEAITYSVRVYLSKVLRLCWKDIDFSDLAEQERMSLANCNLRLFCKPGGKVDNLLQNNGILSLNESMRHGRSFTNKVIRALPQIFKHLLHIHVQITDTNMPIVHRKKVLMLNKISSCNLQDFLKFNLKKVSSYSLNSKYESLCDGLQQEQQNWFYLWKIRNPVLRSYRLKLMYKDIYCNERRARFNLCDSPNCPICGELETVTHQLFDCINAKRLWVVYNKLFNEVITFKQVVIAESNVVKEIVKAVIIRYLIQIDRSEHVSINRLISSRRQACELELKVANNNQFRFVLSKLENQFI